MGYLAGKGLGQLMGHHPSEFFVVGFGAGVILTQGTFWLWDRRRRRLGLTGRDLELSVERLRDLAHFGLKALRGTTDRVERLFHRRLDLGLDAFLGLVEFAETFTHAGSKLRDLLRSEEDEHDQKDQKQLTAANILEHDRKVG